MPIVISNSRDDVEFAAEMTRRQFAALRLKINRNSVLDELKNLKYFKKLRKSRKFETNIFSKWICNGWNTEHILRLTPTLFSDDELIYALQWAFPQSYYSVYTIFLGFLNTQGYQQTSHRSVLRLFGELISQSKFPKTVSFYAKNVNPIEFVNITKYPTESSLYFDPSSDESIETQICQFLKATREMELKDRRIDMKKEFRTKKGKLKRHLTKENWEKVSGNLGYTTVLNLLYRKRIKANYRDIEPFLSNNINAQEVYDNIIKITSLLNFIFEIYSARAIGFKNLNNVAEQLIKKGYSFLEKRLELIENNLSSF